MDVASKYARTSEGMGVNLLVKDIKRSVAFQVEVLGVKPCTLTPISQYCVGMGASGCCMQTILIPIIQYTAV